MEFDKLIETYDFWDAVEIYLETSGTPSDKETLEIWSQLNAHQKSLVEVLYHRWNKDIDDTIWFSYFDMIFPDQD